MAGHTFECVSCKGTLEYTPGQNTMTCPYCGTVNEIPEQEIPAQHVELDFEAAIADFESAAAIIDVQNVTCPGCHAEVTIPPDQTTYNCDFCGTQIIVEGAAQKAMQPQYLLPFTVPRDESRKNYRTWLASRRFAPNALKKKARMTEPLKGVYLPFWTYDAGTSTQYPGKTGVHRTVTRDVKSHTTTTWYNKNGHVSRDFDDILIPASNSVSGKVLRKFKTWDLSKLVTYATQYLAGFTAESYTIDIKGGMEEAKEVMNDQITSDIKRDIGGDHQRIISMNTVYSNVTFKYILLPVWATVYRFKNKSYSVVVNGQTGETQGERPVSWVKIAALVLAIAAIGAGVYFLYQYYHG